MTPYHKARAVEKVFKTLDLEIKNFQQSTGMACLPGCGKCCFKADIEATPLEFLPFAYHLYKQGDAYTWLEKVKAENSTLCLILNSVNQDSKGLCSQYVHRGLICRLFGFSARRNKYGKPELVTCQPIKTELPENVENVQQQIETGIRIPMMGDYYMQLQAIDMELTRKFMPINQAIQYAIEHVLQYYLYRVKRLA